MNVLRGGVIEQANRMLQVLEQGWPGVTSRLHTDALAEIRSWTEVQVQEVPDSQTDTRCSVAGGYVHTTVPPTLTVTRSLSRRRRQFTVLHELGHHLQKNDVGLAVIIRRQPRAVWDAFEDAACDAFAALVLIPDSTINLWASDRSPTAADVVDLYNRTQASRSACCVRAAEHLGSPGFVGVLADDGTVIFAAGHGDVYPPARGTSQATSPLVVAALRSNRDVRVDATHVRYRNGSTSPDLYGDAAWSDDYLMVVAVRDLPGWKRFAPPRVGTGTYVSTEMTCEVCGVEFSPEGACPRCRTARCPSGHCRCTLNAERPCEVCFTKRHPSQFPDPAVNVCRDCTG